MRRLRLAIAIAVLGVLCSGSLQAADRFSFALRFTPGYPQNEFKENVGSRIYGGDLIFAYRLPRSPLSVGASFGFLVYGYESRPEYLSPSIPDIVVDVNTINALLSGHVFLRFQPQAVRVRPYLDVLFGFHHLTTDTSIGDGSADYGSASSNNYNDTVLSYGAGAGVVVPLVLFKRASDGSRIWSIDLDIGGRYLKGGTADYLTEGSILRESGDVTYLLSRSSTDLITFCVGLSFSF